jgi:hypothetical protein
VVVRVLVMLQWLQWLGWHRVEVWAVQQVW